MSEIILLDRQFVNFFEYDLTDFRMDKINRAIEKSACPVQKNTMGQK
jgi:hypothetical protein